MTNPIAHSVSRNLVHCSLFIVSFVLASCSLASDVTPPPGYVQAPVASPTVVEASYPNTTPSIAAGASLYAQNCTRCHGLTGQGDGELATQVAFPIPKFADPELAFTTTPQRWFTIITTGNLDRMMPPWGGTLSEVDRWNLVAHLYSISASAEQVEAGKTVYEANCASCHGESGRGDGSEAKGTLPDFTNQEYMAAKSNKDFFDSLSLPDHNYADKLSEQEMRAAVDYVRAFSFNIALPEVAQGTITGIITNGSGGTIPDGQEVELHLFDNFTEVGVLTTIANGGTFEFTDVEFPAGRALIAATRYNDVMYTSDVSQSTGAEITFDLPITIYESTSDAAAISISRMHLVFQFNEADLQVGELLVIDNGGDKTLRPEVADGPTLQFPLPSNYTSLTFQDGAIGQGYLETADGFADTSPIAPGPNVRQILVSYKLNYSDSLNFSQKLTYPVSEINILLPEAGVTLTGNNVTDAGVQDMQGSKFHLYTLAGLKAGDTIAFTLSGKPTTVVTTSGDQTSTSPTFDLRSILIGALSLGIAIALAAYWWIGRQSTGKSQPVIAPVTSSGNAPKAKGQSARELAARREELLDEIAELDEGFEAGEYPEADYRKEREALKAELRKLLESETRK